MDFAAICSLFDVDHTIQIPFSKGKSFGHNKIKHIQKGLIVTHDIIKRMTFVFVMGDV